MTGTEVIHAMREVVVAFLNIRHSAHNTQAAVADYRNSRLGSGHALPRPSRIDRRFDCTRGSCTFRHILGEVAEVADRPMARLEAAEGCLDRRRCTDVEDLRPHLLRQRREVIFF